MTAQYLWLIRHAHTKNARLGETDHQRELSARGVLQTQAMQQWLNQQINEGDSVNIVCSSAIRTQQTLQHCLPTLSNDAEINDRLYNAYFEELLDELTTACLAFSKHTILIGHNPSISQLASYLSNQTSNNLTFGFSLNTGCIIGFIGNGEPIAKNWQQYSKNF